METPAIDRVALPPPKPRKKVRRLNTELRALKAGESFVGDAATARCYSAYARNHGFKSVQKQISHDQIRVWRTA